MQLRDRDRRGPVRFERSVNVAVSEDSFVVVRVSSPKSIADFFGRWGVLPLAFTNPIFVDADGDGVTRWDLPPPASPPAPLPDAGVSSGGAAGDGTAGDGAASGAASVLGQPRPRLTDASD